MKGTVLEIEGREVTITNPDKVYFPSTGHSKLDLINYYLAIADGALRGAEGRPMAMKRFVNGADSEPFFQKRAPTNRPDWIETVELSYPSGRTADEVVLRSAADLAWVINLGCIDLNPHPVRAEDLDHPDELRVDLDPIRGVPWTDVREVALVVRGVLDDFGLVGWPKTSGSRGFHIFCRIEPRWTFPEVRSAAMALAREVEKRAPEIATSKWWKEERHGVFVDYNQNARDHTTCSAYSVRPVKDARVSTPLYWWEVPTCDPADYTLDSVPKRYAEIGDPGDGIDAAIGRIDGLLELHARQEPVEPTGKRRTNAPLIEVARAETQKEAMEGLERWKARHPAVWPLLAPADVLVDSMRGRSATWTRIRLNLRNVPEDQRPPQEALEVDYNPWAGLAEGRPPQR